MLYFNYGDYSVINNFIGGWSDGIEFGARFLGFIAVSVVFITLSIVMVGILLYLMNLVNAKIKDTK